MTDCDSVSNGSDTTAVRGKSDESKSSGETYSHASRANGDSTLQQIGLQETKIVRSSKICVYVFLLLVAIGGSLLTWLFLKEEEQLSLAQQVSQGLFMHNCKRLLTLGSLLNPPFFLTSLCSV